MSSFKKRVPAASGSAGPTITKPPAGTRVSAYNSSVLISTGVASVDDVLGGGCPLGSILLVEEDQDTSYAQLLLKYWLAQGLCCPDQQVILASSGLDQTPEEITAKLPYSDDVVQTLDEPRASTSQTVLTDDEDDSLPSEDSGSNSMKIAFRYESMKRFETSVEGTSSTSGNEAPYCSVFDLTKTLALPKSAQARIAGLDVVSSDDPYNATLAHVKQNLSATPATSATRIAVQSLGSLAWGDIDITAIYRFLLALKLILREHANHAAAFVTIPGYLIRSLSGGPAQLRRLEWLCDTVVELESFAGSPALQSVFPTYSGFLHIHRLPTPQSLLPPSAKLSVLRGLAPGSHSTSSGAGGMDNNLGFKLKRRRGIVIETLHLDEGGGTGERRTTPAQSMPEPQSAPTPGITAPQPDESLRDPAMPVTTEKPSATKKLQRRRIRFDDEASENPSGILGVKEPEKQPHSHLKSGLRTDKPELYEF